MRRGSERRPNPSEVLPSASWTKRLGLGIPAATTAAALLWFDVLGLRGSSRPVVSNAAAEAPASARVASPSSPCPAGQGNKTAWRRCTSLQRSKKAEASRGAAVAWSKALSHGTCDDGSPANFSRSRPPLVGASIAVHPPKFYAVGKFLQQYAACPAAVEALRVFLVFSDEQDMRLFEAALACRYPHIPSGVWEPVVVVAPDGGWEGLDSGPTINQKIAAYKKWHGILHMMDLGADAPTYGLMLDGELLLYANGGEGPDLTSWQTQQRDCGEGSPWTTLLERLRAREEAKTFPAAVVSNTLITYDFGKFTRSGQDYDRAILAESARFVNIDGCGDGAGCQEVRQQVEECLFSWWTDLPWLRISTAEEMARSLGSKPMAAGGWRAASAGMKFERFEHIGYQQWCVMHKGFHFRNVTAITGFAKWGSYMEDPVDGSKLGELEPLWVSSQALQRSDEGVIGPLSRSVPPLLIFHADQGNSRARREENRDDWKFTLKALMKLQGIEHEYVNDL